MAGFDNDIMFAQGSDVGVFPNTTSSDNSTEFSRSGADVKAIVYNSSNTASSTAHHEVRVEGTSAGDPWYQLSIGTTKSYAIGQDQADTFFRITTAAAGTIDPSSGQTLLTFDEGIVGPFRALFPIPNMALASAAISSEVDLNVFNSDNTMTDSNSRVNIQVGGDSGGDPYIAFTGGTWSSWSMGVANANADEFVTFQQNTPSTTAIITQQTTLAGEVTFPLQPAFQASTNPAIAQNNVTGAGTVYTILYNSERFDIGNNYASPTFTAPVTGKYLMEASVRLNGLTAAATVIRLNLITSNKGYQVIELNPGNLFVVGDSGITVNGSMYVDMDASDTASVQVQVDGLPGDTVSISVASTGNQSFAMALEN